MNRAFTRIGYSSKLTFKQNKLKYAGFIFSVCCIYVFNKTDWSDVNLKVAIEVNT